MGGGAVLFAARSIIDASYSRDAETRADDFAIHGMHALGRSPEPLGELLVRMTGGSRVPTIIDSHPVSAERLERMKKDARPVTGEPILTEQEWQALKNICRAERGNTGTDAAPSGPQNGRSGTRRRPRNEARHRRGRVVAASARPLLARPAEGGYLRADAPFV